MTTTEHQGGRYREIPRNFIKGAPYNPREITSYARGMLKKKIAEVGVVTPLVWNKRSGNLVSGHQRLSILDDLEESHDYVVAVKEVDVDEKTEREMNIALNNPQSQGEFDRDLIVAMLKDGMELFDAGLTKIDLEFMFGDMPELDGVMAAETKAAEPIIAELEKIATVSPYRSEFRKLQKENQMKVRGTAAVDGDYYVIVAFEPGTLKPWLKAHGFDQYAKYLIASQIEPLFHAPAET